MCTRDLLVEVVNEESSKHQIGAQTVMVSIVNNCFCQASHTVDTAHVCLRLILVPLQALISAFSVEIRN